MTISWTAWTNAREAAGARRAVTRMCRRMDVAPENLVAEPYEKTGGHKVTFTTAEQATDWERRVFDALDLAQRVGSGWGLHGSVLDDPGATSNSISVAGVEMVDWTLLRNAGDSDPNASVQAVRAADGDDYSLPKGATLVSHLAMLFRVLIDGRRLAYEGSTSQLACLLDVVHNVPDLLSRWPDAKEVWIVQGLRDYEEKYLAGTPVYTEILEHGPRPGWQLRWKPGRS